MRIRFVAAVLATAGLLFVPVLPMAQSSDEVLRKQAVDLEKAKGDVKGAIEIYRKLAQSSDKKTAAEATEALRRLMNSVQAPAAPTGVDKLLQGFNTPPDLSPDGRLVAGGRLVGSETRMQAAIVVRDVSSQEERVLASGLDGFARRVRFSPDGSLVAAYVLRSLNAAGDAGQPIVVSLVVVSVAPSGKPPLVLPIWTSRRSEAEEDLLRSIGWSRDSRAIAYISNQSGKADLGIVDVRSGEPRTLGVEVSNDSGLSWSPDGSQIAVRSIDSIKIIAPETGRIRSLAAAATPGERLRLLGWPAPGSLAISELVEKDLPTRTRVSLLAVETGERTAACSGYPLTSGSESGLSIFGGTADLCLPVSPDGRTELVWRAASKRLMVRDTRAGVERPLVAGFGEERFLSLGGDRDLVLFLSNRNARWGLYAVKNNAGAEQTPALIAPVDDLPVNAALYAARNTVLGGLTFIDQHIYRVKMDGATGRAAGELEQLTQDSSFNITPTLSPDGSRIAYFTRRSGLLKPALMNADGNAEQAFTQLTALNIRTPMQWRSAQQLIAADAAEEGRGVAFSTVDLNSGTRTSLDMRSPVDGPERGSYGLDRSLDGVIVAVGGLKAGQPIEFRSRSLVKRGESVVASIASPVAPLDYFIVSSDGSRLAYLLSTQFSNNAPCQPCELGIINLKTGDRRILPVPNGAAIPVAFSPDHRFLLYGPLRPRVMNVDTGESWPLMDPDRQPQWSQAGSWSPDGTFIVLSAGTQRTVFSKWDDISADGVVKRTRGGGR